MSCPAHRTLITRQLKGLDDIISYTAVHWHLGSDGECGLSDSNYPLLFILVGCKLCAACRVLTLPYAAGWRFATSEEKLPGANVTPDPLHKDFTHLRNIYFSINPEYQGRFTVPVLYDKKTKTIVSNEVSFAFAAPIPHLSGIRKK